MLNDERDVDTLSGQFVQGAVIDLALSDVWFKYDPFDLALTRTDSELLDALPSVLAERLHKLRGLLAEAKRVNEGARPHVGLAKQWPLRHTEYRLEAEVAYVADLLNAAPATISNSTGNLAVDRSIGHAEADRAI